MEVLNKPFLIALDKQVNENLGMLKTKLNILNYNHSNLLEDNEVFCLHNKTFNIYQLKYTEVGLTIYNKVTKEYVNIDVALFEAYDIKKIQEIENILSILNRTVIDLNKPLQYISRTTTITKENKTRIINILRTINKEFEALIK